MRQEASWVVLGVTRGGVAEHIDALVEHGVLPVLPDSLGSYDVSTVSAALESATRRARCVRRACTVYTDCTLFQVHTAKDRGTIWVYYSTPWNVANCWRVPVTCTCADTVAVAWSLPSHC